jgi:hypothetical protein
VSKSLRAAGRYESVAERIATIAGQTVAAVEVDDGVGFDTPYVVISASRR